MDPNRVVFWIPRDDKSLRPCVADNSLSSGEVSAHTSTNWSATAGRTPENEETEARTAAGSGPSNQYCRLKFSNRTGEGYATFETLFQRCDDTVIESFDLKKMVVLA